MQKYKHSAIAAAVAIMAISFGANAQDAAPVSADSPNQAGVVYPGRATELTASGQSPAETQTQAQVQRQTGVATSPQYQQIQPGQQVVNVDATNGAPEMPPLPGESAKKSSTARKTAPQLAVEDTLPDNLDVQIRELRRRMDDVQRAASPGSSFQPKPVTRTQSITQAAGEEPVTVRTTLGTPSNLVIFDVTGAPWPIEYATPGDTSQFDVLLPVAGTPNIQIRPKNGYAYGGLSIKLVDNPIPLSITLTTAQKEVDTRVDLRVSHRGPNAKAPIVDRTFFPSNSASDSALISFLDSTPPAGARELRTSYSNIKAWILNGNMYLRTDATLVSPLWNDSITSPSGVTRAYLLPAVPSVVVSFDGRIIAVNISE